MTGASVLAFGAISSLGEGRRAFQSGAIGERAAVAIDDDPFFARAGLARPIAARAHWLESDGRDRATQLLARALEACVGELDRACPGVRSRRIGLCIGTSSGGIIASEALFRAVSQGRAVTRALARDATYFGPFEQAVDGLGFSFSPRVQLLGACASSALAVGLALRWLTLGRCEIALAGGYDALSLFVASGFESLRATTATRPRPFRVGRDGLALGEGAAVIALGSADLAKAHRVQSFGYVAGFGASTDAVHLTAPDPTGRGLARAAKAALNDANVARVGLISAHATATPFNDPAEAKAIAAALGGAPPEGVHPFKAQIGHTLGAAGALEALAALDAVQRGVKPAAAGDGNIDPDCAVPLFASNERLVDATALKLSSAFGGTNAALVLRSAPPEAREPSRRGRARAVFLRGFAAIPGALESADFTAWLARQHPHAHRLDRMARLALSAARALSGSTEAPSTALFPRGTGILLGHALATLEQNELFDSRLRERGPRAVEPRRFPATSPNAAAGECAIALGLEGPSFAVGASLHGAMEALAVARDLVAVGDAPAMLVIAADLQGTTSSALLSAAEAPPICPGACAALLTAEPAAGAVPLEGAIPETLAGGRDWAWAGPFGHDELRAYLAGL